MSNGSSYYRCTDRLSKYPLERECHEHGINVPVFDALVWQNIKELLLNPQLVVEQAKRRQNASPLQSQLNTLQEKLKKLNDEQRRYDKAYGQGIMSEHRYKDVMNELNDRREAMVSEINALEDEMANQKPITVEQYFDGTIKRVDNLNFTEKKAIIKKVITKIVAARQEISIWGRIPLLATPNGETIDNNGNGIYANHLENEREVGLNAKHWYTYLVTQQPFELKLTMPPTDRGGRGYSDEYVANAIKELQSYTQKRTQSE